MGEWIPLMDYAMKKGVSLSTLRRHIKANKVQYRVENGRYLLFVEKNDPVLAGRPVPAPAPTKNTLQSTSSVSQAVQSAVQAVAHGSGATSKPAAQSDDFLVNQLQTKLKKAQEEIAELKTLIAFYEESLGFAKSSPAQGPALNRFDG